MQQLLPPVTSACPFGSACSLTSKNLIVDSLLIHVVNMQIMCRYFMGNIPVLLVF
jgi:hypothetical protein